MLFIPIFGWFVIGGFAIRVAKNVMTGVEGLPEYGDWGGDFSRGMMAFIGSLIYNAPLILLSCCSSTVFNNHNVIQCCASVVSFMYGIAIAPFWYAAIAHFAMTEKFDIFLDFNGRFADFNNHTSEATSLWANVFALNLIMVFAIPIGLVLCCIPGLIAIAANIMITAHLAAQWGQVIGATGGGTVNATPASA